MIEDYLIAGAYQVTKGPVTLYSGLSSGTLTLTGTWPANGSKLAIVASVIAGHTDCVGTLMINGSETITFTQAGRKTSTVSLTALPTIVTANLDCNLVITVLDSGLAPIMTETLTAINTMIQTVESQTEESTGVWKTVRNTCIYSNSLMNVNDVVRDGTTNYTIKKKDAFKDIGGTVELYTYLA